MFYAYSGKFTKLHISRHIWCIYIDKAYNNNNNNMLPHQYNNCANHVRMPPTPPTLHMQAPYPRKHTTHTSTLPTQAHHLSHPRMHPTHVTHATTNSIPFLKLLSNIYHFVKPSFQNILNICLYLYYFGAIEINQLKISEQLYRFYNMND